MATTSLTARTVAFDFAGSDPRWSRRLPEFACVANGVSLLMPHVEPYVVRSVRATLPDLDGGLRADAAAYVRQEAQHHAQHRRYNDVLVQSYPSLLRVERVAARIYGAIERRGSRAFNVAFATGFETIAFAIARWVDPRTEDLFAGAADEPAASLLVWHLAEEVEHKSVAFDVCSAVGVSRLRYAVATAVSLIVFAVLTLLASMCMLVADRRIFHPIAMLRLLWWSVTFAFVLLPILAVSATRGHHPVSLGDPRRLSQWLAEQDHDDASSRIDDVLPRLATIARHPRTAAHSVTRPA